MSSAVYLAAAFAVGAAASYMYADDIVSFVKQFIKKRWVRVCVCVCPLRNHTHKGPSVPRDDFRGGGTHSSSSVRVYVYVSLQYSTKGKFENVNFADLFDDEGDDVLSGVPFTCKVRMSAPSTRLSQWCCSAPKVCP